MRSIPEKSSRGLSSAGCIGLLVRNILVSRTPLYGLGEWVEVIPCELLGMLDEETRHINDDRIGRSLEKLFDADRSSMLTEIVVSAVREFNISMNRFHNDSTSVALSGLYRMATGKDMRMKKTINLTFGHSKDHRKDLKQLVWIPYESLPVDLIFSMLPIQSSAHMKT
jgi:hypothetical protein